MGAIYGRRIRAGKMTIDEVPEMWREATQHWLDTHPEG